MKQDIVGIFKFKCIHLTNRSLSSVCGRTVHSYSRLAPPPHQSGLTLLWDGITFSNQHLLQVSQRGCVWSLWHQQHTQDDPTSVQWG